MIFITNMSVVNLAKGRSVISAGTGVGIKSTQTAFLLRERARTLGSIYGVNSEVSNTRSTVTVGPVEDSFPVERSAGSRDVSGIIVRAFNEARLAVATTTLNKL